MFDKTQMDLDLIYNLSAQSLMELPHEDLDRLIHKANEMVEEARILKSWLTAIRYEKRLREDLNDPGKGGDHE